MKFLITGGMGVNGAVAARLMVRDGLRPLLMDNRVDLHVDRRHQESSRYRHRRYLRSGGVGESRR